MTLTTILILAILVSCAVAAYGLAVAHERGKTIARQDKTINELQSELKTWQNKALPTPLGFETRERVKRDKSNDVSPIPKIVTRTDINQRLANDERMHPKMRYERVKEKAKKIMESE